MNLIKLSAVFIGLIVSACPAGDSRNVKLVKGLEASLVLPADAEPLNKYDRIYAIGRTQIKGVLLFNGRSEGEFRIVPEGNVYMERKDGGCEAIQVTYDRSLKRWTSVVCNGNA
jgi:hypothetical protein